MNYMEKRVRSQISFLPECVEDYINEENPVRVIDAFVDSLDMEALGFQKAKPAQTGRPAYDPRDLLKLYLYGYLNRIRSSRMLMREWHGLHRAIRLSSSCVPPWSRGRMWCTSVAAVSLPSFLHCSHKGCAARNPARIFLQALPYLLLATGSRPYLSYWRLASFLCSSQYRSSVSLGQPG